MTALLILGVILAYIILGMVTAAVTYRNDGYRVDSTDVAAAIIFWPMYIILGILWIPIHITQQWIEKRGSIR